MRPPQSRLERELVHKVNHRKQRQQDVSIHEITRVKRSQRRPALHKSQKDIGNQAKVGIPWIPQGLVRQLVRAVSLRLPRGAEADVNQTDGAPDQKGRDTTEVDNVPVRLACARADVHHREGPACIGEDDGVNRNATTIRPAKEPGRFSVLRHIQEGTAANVNRAVDGAQAGDEDEGVDQVGAVCPAGIVESDGHGRLEGMAGPAGEIGGVRRAGQTEEEGAAHVDDDDADEDLADGVRDGDTRVFGLGGGYGDGFDTCVEGGAKDEDRGDAAEAIGEGAGVVPVLEADGFCAFDASGDVTILGSVQVRI